MVLHTCLPERLAGIAARHCELQRVLAQSLHRQRQHNPRQGVGLGSALCPPDPARIPVAPDSAVSPMGTWEQHPQAAGMEVIHNWGLLLRAWYSLRCWRGA